MAFKEASRKGKVSMGADTRFSAMSARLPHTLHIWSYHGSSRRRSSSEERVALPVVAQLALNCTVSSTTRAIDISLVLFCLTATCVKS